MTKLRFLAGATAPGVPAPKDWQWVVEAPLGDRVGWGVPSSNHPGWGRKARNDWLKAAASLSGKLGTPTSPDLLEPHRAPRTKGTKVGLNPGTKI